MNETTDTADTGRVDGATWGQATGHDVGDAVWHDAAETVTDGTGNVTDTTGNVGVITRINRDAKGRLLPGHTLPGPGHPRKDTGLIKALKAHYTPDVIIQRLEDTYRVAERRGSWRGMLETNRLAIEYTEGTPTKKIQSVRGSPLEFLQALASMQLGTGDNDGEDTEASIDIA
jgi:hypothetical protein